MLENSVSRETLLQFAETENWFTYADFYTSIAADPELRTYVEVGAWKGHSVRHLVQALQKTGKDFSVYAVDLWGDLPASNELFVKYPDQIPILRDIYNFNLVESGTREDVKDIKCDSVKGAEHFADNSIDCLFLDAAHDFEAVLRDLDAWYPKVRKGGVLCGHDIKDAQVYLAVHTVMQERGQTLLARTDENVWAVVITKD